MQERANGDGIKVDYDSPEALEEVFWRVFCGSDYIKPGCLVPMSADSETVEKFRSFIALILKDQCDKLYLSKNNGKPGVPFFNEQGFWYGMNWKAI